MKTLTSIAIAVAMILAAPAASAQENADGFYAGADAGLFFDRSSCDNLKSGLSAGTTASCDDDSLALRLNGGWQFSDYLALEAGYTFTGDTSYTVGGTLPLIGGGSATNVNIPIDVSYSALDLSLRGILPLGERFSVYGRAGLAAWDYEVSGGTGTGTSGGSQIAVTLVGLQGDSDTDLIYGLGANYKVADNLTARLDWIRLDADDGEADTITLGGAYRF